MSKILYTANTDRHINLCHIPYLKMLKEKGHTIHVATNTDFNVDYSDKKIRIPIYRTPFKINNIKAIFILKRIINKEKYDLIITSTPMGSVVTRLAAKKLRKKYNTRVIYIAHGFHFYKGCKLRNYLLYYPIEKYLSKYTDTIITINKEDYEFAKKDFNTDIRYVKGIGFDSKKFDKILTMNEQVELRKKIGIGKDDFVVSYIAEISKRKRQEYLIKCLKDVNLKNTKILLVGDNILGNKIPKLIKKYKLDSNIIMLGFVNNVSEILDISNLVISVSNQEGLPLNVMEAMYKNKNILVTNCRGNRDLIKNNENGIVIPIDDKISLINSIKNFRDNNYPKFNNKELSKTYSIDSVINQYEKIFDDVLKNNC